MRNREWTLVVVFLSLTAIAVDQARSQQAKETPVQKTESALDESVAWEFIDTPLRDVLKFLEDQHAVKIDLAPETKQGPKRIDPDLPITMILKSISLRSALHLLLDPHDLEVTVKPDGTLLLVPGTKELREKRVESKVQRAAHADLQLKLQEKGRIAFINTPLSDVLAFLSDQHNCTIVLDRKALAAVGIPRDEPVTWTVATEQALGRLLKFVLLPLDLQVVIQDEVLLVVSRDKNADPKPSPEVAKALATKLDVDLAKPLYDIAAHLTEKTGVPFIPPYYRALKAAGIDSERVLVVKAKDATPAEVLKGIEPKLPLKLIERDGIVLISIEPRK
jgi:hypothetical protein